MCIADPEDMLQRWYGDYMKLPPKEKQVMFHQPEAFDTQKVIRNTYKWGKKSYYT